MAPDPIVRASVSTGRVTVTDPPASAVEKRLRTDPRTGEYVGREPHLGLRAGTRPERKAGKVERAAYPDAFTPAGRKAQPDKAREDAAPAPKPAAKRKPKR